MRERQREGRSTPVGQPDPCGGGGATGASLVMPLVALLLGACATGSAAGSRDAAQVTHASSSQEPPIPPPDRTDAGSLLDYGFALMRRQRCAEAIRDGLDPAIAIYEGNRAEGTVYAAGRTPGAGIVFGLLAAVQRQPEGSSGGVIALVGPDWPDAYYLRAYCQVELGDWEGAERSLRKALEFIHDDPVYLCELGHVYQEHHRNWPMSLDFFRQAQASADTMWEHPQSGPTAENPEGLPMPFGPLSHWRRRARRGVGYSLIELGRLDEAEQLYRELLEMDASDETSRGELEYIRQLRARGGGAGRPTR